jgi:hypothetical protein
VYALWVYIRKNSPHAGFFVLSGWKLDRTREDTLHLYVQAQVTQSLTDNLEVVGGTVNNRRSDVIPESSVNDHVYGMLKLLKNQFRVR